jgi:cytochrome c
MSAEKLAEIINAIESGNPGQALAIAKSSLEWMNNMALTEDCPTDYPILELVVDDARKLVERAVGLCKTCGRHVALAEFSNHKGKFVNGQLYIFVLDTNGIMLAHGINEKYIGKDFLRVVDFEGKPFINEIVRTADDKGSGWTEYKWINPVSGEDEHKIVYFEKYDGMIICGGIYQGI